MVDETEKQRWERNFGDLLQELRVAQTGVQILFAFLLALPFTAQFDKVTASQRVMYLVALVAAAFATGAIISPVAFHRLLFRRGRTGSPIAPGPGRRSSVASRSSAGWPYCRSQCSRSSATRSPC